MQWRNAVAVEYLLYDHVIYDNSQVERDFALELDRDEQVKLFFKIPDKFKIPTPIGNYNPDWAVYVENENEKEIILCYWNKGLNKLYGFER